MAHPLQVTVADQHGVDVAALARAITATYQSVNGYPVTVKIGQGLHVDGTPEGMLRIVDRR